MISNIIFDLDGTLIDSIAGMRKSYRHILSILGVNLDERSLLRCIGWGYTVVQTLHYMLPKDKKHLAEKYVEPYRQHYSHELIIGTELQPNVLEVLDTLSDKEMTIATSKKTNFANKILSHFGVKKYFKIVVGGDAVLKEKPHPEMIDKILSDLNWDRSSTVIVGDTTADIIAGKNAGILSCGVTFGYGLAEDIRSANPNYVIEDLIDLIDIVRV